MSSEKTVEVKEVSTGKTRLFRKRDTVVVLTPKEVIDTFEGVPLSISIRAMSHGEAETRKRLKAKIQQARDASNTKAGITRAEVTKYITEFSDLEHENKEKSDEDQYAALQKFQKKWSKFQDKSELRDLDGIYEAEDAVRADAVRCVVSNCISLNFEDESIDIGVDTIDAIHPDLFYWILKSIEDESYLTDGEVLGFL